MSENERKPEIRDGDPNQVRKITLSLLKDYLHRIETKDGEIICPVCKGTLWDIPVSKNDEDQPNLVTFPMPFNPGFGVWSFPVSCNNCGDMKFFEASKVLLNIKKYGGI
ncbi:hypothetical protein [Yersinia enterocolitica]|uniref:hypothetical protein n=1 Tax=Yersinia enterocolitica TaxID=630 RepID=UPI003D79262C